MKNWITLAVALTLCAPLFGGNNLPAVHVGRARGPIKIDGDLSDEGWKTAVVVDTFYEVRPGNNTPPQVQTVARLAYDDRYFYVAVHCQDPHPDRIRAPFVDRDNVLGTDDNLVVFLDTRNDRRSAIELRMNPRGVQGDAIYNNADDTEDFSPDFFYDTAARITSEGWDAEYRIPFSSLRYTGSAPTWSFLIWRNYPREARYAYYSSPQPRQSTCVMCQFREIVGLEGLPPPGHLIAAPYLTEQTREHPGDPSNPRSPFHRDPLHTDAGGDLKWSPRNDTTIDATVNPDFSQIESDEAQISANERFAVFLPEKRPFFLEGVDLLRTPIQAVYTRTITQPRWGLRATGKVGATAYTLLVSRDEGGGVLVLPGPQGSRLVPQDVPSTVAIGRVRHDVGQSFVGLVFTDREVEGGGHNRLIGPDFLWRRGESDTVTGQLLYSDTANTPGPDPVSATGTSHAALVNWYHQTSRLDWTVQGKSFGDRFRADDGFVPQVGYHEGNGTFALRFFPTHGFFNFVRPSLFADYVADNGGNDLLRTITPGIATSGRHNFQGTAAVHVDETVRSGGRQLHQTYATYLLQIDPSRRLVRISIEGRLGDSVDFANSRVGRGGTVALNGIVRPTDRLELKLTSNRQWLDARSDGLAGRVFTAKVQRLKGTYSLSATSLLRLVAQYVSTERDPRLYDSGSVLRRDGKFQASLLYSYKINWQTVFFLGYGDDRLLTEENALLPANRTLFAKISYAFQR